MMDPAQRTKAFVDLIEEQSKVQRTFAKMNKDSLEKQKYDIPEVAPPERTVEEELADITKQKQDALNSLSKIVKPTVAGEFLSKLNDEETVFFNRTFNDFADAIKPFKNIDAPFLGILFNRYSQKFDKTQGIEIPLEASDLRSEEAVKEPVRQAKAAIQARIDAFTPPNSQERFTDALNETQNIIDQSRMDADTLDAEINNLLTQKVNLDVQQDNEEKVIKRDRKRELRRRGADPAAIKTMYDNMKRELRAHFDSLRQPLLDRITELTRERDSIRDTGYANQEERNMMRFNQERAIPTALPPVTEEDPRFYSGRGLKKTSIRGPGITRRKKPEARYAPFGRYVIHLPSLHQGYLNIKFPSLSPIPSQPRIPISDAVKDVLVKAVETGKLTPSSRLKSEDTRLLQKACQRAQLDHPFLLAEDEDEVERFEILRGEINAGNNNPEIVKELKKLLLKFMAEGRVTRRDANQLMYELTSLF